MNRIFTFSLLFMLCFQVDGQIQIIDNAKIQLKLNDGKAKLYSNNYRAALVTFREVLTIDPKNAMANMRIAQCQAKLGKYDLALKYAEKAYAIDPEVDKELYIVLGEANHRLGNLDIAKTQYQTFKTKINKREQEDYAIDNLINQIDYAKAAMNAPVNAVITNLGDNINTSSPEYGASVSSDGKTLIFTSRRSDTKGGNTDPLFDHQYYEDIYISNWNEERGEWDEASSAEGRLNTEFHDACLNISPDGEQIYVYRNIPRTTRSGDIYVSKKNKRGTWGSPKPITKSKTINSTYFESSASVTADGKTLVFVSDRPGGQGLADIYMSTFENKKWSKPVNLGETINTSLDEKFVFIHPDGKTLFFSSQGHDNIGGYDIFVSYLENGQWTAPKNLGYPINTVGEERTFSVTADGKTAYVSAEYENSKGSYDVYKVDISSLGLIK